MENRTNNILEIRGLTKHYEEFSLQDITLSLPYGCIMGVMGENGAGKSTTIKAILGLIHPDDGEILMFGENICETGRKIRDDVGLVLDGLNLPAGINALEVGKMMGGLYRNWDMPLYRGYLEQFSISPKKKIKDYSRGMKMKLSMAIALSHGAKLLILDEPTSGLDPIVREEVLDILREFVIDEEHSVLISSHIISDLEKTADYAAFLHEGKLMLCEEKDRLLEEYRIMKGGREEIEELERSGQIKIIGLRENQFGTEALVYPTGGREKGSWEGLRLKSGADSRAGLSRDMVVEAASLEEIMLYLVRKELKGEGTR